VVLDDLVVAYGKALVQGIPGVALDYMLKSLVKKDDLAVF
jgi:hypothetical protein